MNCVCGASTPGGCAYPDMPAAADRPDGCLKRRTSWYRDLLGADLPEPRFAVDGLLPEGLTFMAGAPKLGKWWLCLGLAIAVASGGRALGNIADS